MISVQRGKIGGGIGGSCRGVMKKRGPILHRFVQNALVKGADAKKDKDRQ